METRWYPIKKDGKFYLGADGLPYWFDSLSVLLVLQPNCYSYITHDSARKHNDYRFDWTPRCFTISEVPF